MCSCPQMSLFIIKKWPDRAHSRKAFIIGNALAGLPNHREELVDIPDASESKALLMSNERQNNIWPVWAKSPQSCPWWLYEVAEAEGSTASSVIGPVVIIIIIIVIIIVIVIIIKRPALALPITASIIIAVVPKTLLTDNALEPTLATIGFFAISQQIVLYIFEDSSTVLHSHSIWLGGKKIKERHP